VAALARVALPGRTFLAGALLALALVAALAGRPLSAGPALLGDGRAATGLARGGSGGGLIALPPGARAVASATLGAARAGYHVGRSGGAFTARNAAQGFAARFAGTGVTLSASGLTVGLRLRAVGYGSAPADVGAAHLQAHSNRVLYGRQGLSEWYVNGPLGLEQGFTLDAPPHGPRAAPLTLLLSLSGEATATRHPGGQSLTLTHGGSSLRYGSLLATDARGRALRSWLELHGRNLLLRIDARGALYPLRIDPLMQQGAKIVPGDETGAPLPDSEFGTSVALSADGNSALVGGPGDEAKGSMGGAAWVFTRSGSSWSEQAKLTGADEEGPGQFGISVALSADGSTALIGGINDQTGKATVGAAWVFTRSGPAWTQQGSKLTGGGEVGDGRFGKSVALSANGNTALIGGYFDGGPKAEPQTGAAWVFTRSGPAWTEQAKLTGTGEVGLGQFGLSVALAADGNTALVGAPLDKGEVGAAWVFARSGAGWAQQTELTGSGESGSGNFGAAAALSADGNTALIGGPGDGTGGATWAFGRSGSAWAQQGAKLVPSDESGPGQFGAGVALSSDGNTALVGASLDAETKVPTGAAWEFARSGASWSQQGPKLHGSAIAKEAEFGAAVALSADGATAFIGGPIDEVAVGAGWAFIDPPPGVATGAATGVGLVSATLNGTVGAGPSSSVYFQYGSSTAYGGSTPPQQLGRSGEARAVAVPLAILIGIPYHFRIVAQNSAGSSVGADQAFIGSSPGGKAVAPVIAGASQTHRVWRLGSRLASIARTRRAPVGTTYSFALNAPAHVSFAFTQQAAGRRAPGGRCVAQTRRNRGRHACRRTIVVGTLAFAAHAGRERVAFQGRLSRTRGLARGAYALRITARSAEGLTSNTAQLNFAIVR
jgi:hypothetical protein